MSNKIERYLHKNIYNENDSIAIILYEYKEIREFLKLCMKYDMFTNEQFILWRIKIPFVKNFHDVFKYAHSSNIYNPASEEFKGNLILIGTITNRDSQSLNLIWSYTSAFFDTERRISKDEYSYQIESAKIFTLKEFEKTIRNILGLKTSNQNQKIENLKI